MPEEKSPIRETFFASPQRTDEAGLKSEIRQIGESPVMEGLLKTVGGLLAILDENRQILAVNASLADLLGIDDLAEILGLRPGEALGCIRSEEAPGGCGTGPFCSSCGAALAIVNSLGLFEPAERNCFMEVKQGNEKKNLALQVRAHPVKLENKRYVLLFLHDISVQEKRSSLERTFFHDMNNLLQGLNSASEMLAAEVGSNKLVDIVSHASRMLIKEVEIQRCLLRDDPLSCHVYRQTVILSQLLEELRNLFSENILTRDRHLLISSDYPDLTFQTDMALLIRILSNMVINALEASNVNEAVTLWTEEDGEWLRFIVHNRQYIPEENTGRIFQRNFTTKSEPGRGIGTYSMKLLGESVLGGKVEFETDPERGTLFKYSLPLKV